MRRFFTIVGGFALLVLGGGLSFVGWWIFRFCEFYYTDAYHSDRMMHFPADAPETWRDSLGYWSGLALFSLPSLIPAVPGFIFLFIVLRRIFSKQADIGPDDRLHTGT